MRGSYQSTCFLLCPPTPLLSPQVLASISFQLTHCRQVLSPKFAVSAKGSSKYSASGSNPETGSWLWAKHRVRIMSFPAKEQNDKRMRGEEGEEPLQIKYTLYRNSTLLVLHRTACCFQHKADLWKNDRTATCCSTEKRLGFQWDLTGHLDKNCSTSP